MTLTENENKTESTTEIEVLVIPEVWNIEVLGLDKDIWPVVTRLRCGWEYAYKKTISPKARSLERNFSYSEEVRCIWIITGTLQSPCNTLILPILQPVGDYQFVQDLRTIRASLVARRLKHLPTMRKTRVRFLGQEDPLEKEMATYSSILGWRIPWMEEHGGLQPTGSQRVPQGHKESDTTEQLHFHFHLRAINEAIGPIYPFVPNP